MDLETLRVCVELLEHILESLRANDQPPRLWGVTLSFTLVRGLGTLVASVIGGLVLRYAIDAAK